MKVDGFILHEKSSLMILGLPLLNWIRTFKLPVAKTASKNFGTLTHPMEFLSPEDYSLSLPYDLA